MTDNTPRLSDTVQQIQDRHNSRGWKWIGRIAYGVVIIALSLSTIVSSAVVLVFKAAFDEYSAQKNCADAWGREITEANTTFWTEGFGGLLVALTVEDQAVRQDAVDGALVALRTSRVAVQEVVADRAEWVAEGQPTDPCPV